MLRKLTSGGLSSGFVITNHSDDLRLPNRVSLETDYTRSPNTEK